MRRATWAIVIGACAATACGLSVTGSGSADSNGGGAANDDGASDTSMVDGTTVADGAGDSASVDATTPADAGDAQATTDASTVDASCVRVVKGYGEGGTMEGFSTDAAPTVDGVLDDWACVPFYDLTSANAYVESTTPISGTFALQWTSTHLYFAMHVENTVTPAGTDSTDPFQNDSVEVYLMQDDAPTGLYRTHDHHYIVDYKNLLADYDMARTTPPSTDITTMVTKKGTTYDVEMAVTAGALGHASLTAAKMGFDLELNKSINNMQSGVLLYGLRSGASTTNSQCGGGTELPYCNTHAVVELSLVP
jgi:hypothetical protein